MKPDSAAEIVASIDKMPSLSVTAAKIMQVANDINSSAKELSRVISLDPTLTARVLKLVNSAYFGLPQKIPSVVRGIVILGLNTIKNLSISTALLDNFPNKETRTGFDIDSFWKHSLACAVTSKLIAREMGIQKNDAEGYFLAGLLHDIGKLILNFYMPNEFKEILLVTSEKNISIYDAEVIVIGMSHTEIGAMLGRKWSLTPGIIDVIEFHHEPENSQQDKKLTTTVHLADILIKSQRIGFSGDYYLDHMNEEQVAILGLQENRISAIIEEMGTEVENAAAFLQVITNK